MKDPQPSVPIRLLTHNIRYATSTPFPEEAPWAQRKRGMISQFRYHAANASSSPFICLQEVLHEQLLDILDGLNTTPTTIGTSKEEDNKWTSIGVGRTDGHTSGEYNPILYRSHDWTLLDSSTVWLSTTPSKPSKSWDAGSTRIVTYGVFRHATTRKIVLAMNTHLDDQGAQARVEGVRIILKLLKELVVEGKRWDVNGAFLCGDLNCTVQGEAYRLLNEDGKEGSGVRDLVRMLPSPSTGQEAEQKQKTKREKGSDAIKDTVAHYGNINTYSAFGASDPNSAEAPQRIDFIHLETGVLVRQKRDRWNMPSGSKKDSDGDDGEDEDEPWKVDGYAVLPNRFDDDGVWISDHRAVVGDVRLVE